MMEHLQGFYLKDWVLEIWVYQTMLDRERHHNNRKDHSTHRTEFISIKWKTQLFSQAMLKFKSKIEQAASWVKNNIAKRRSSKQNPSSSKKANTLKTSSLSYLKSILMFSETQTYLLLIVHNFKKVVRDWVLQKSIMNFRVMKNLRIMRFSFRLVKSIRTKNRNGAASPCNLIQKVTKTQIWKMKNSNLLAN